MSWFQTDTTKLLGVLERIATALEERLPPIEDANKIEALQAKVDFLTNELKLAAMRLANQPDLGMRCIECGSTIKGIGAVAGSLRCLDCHKKPRP